ncbi:hypothetical protein ACFWU5_16535 [Nocardia sp. NPDC058640]|uniref:hypothetical protein n=1 Tax=Nocardia sp. NPDC058640 TaxID=3346571 RepID=UPI0036507437
MRLLRLLARHTRRRTPETPPTLINIRPVTAAQYDAAQDYPTGIYPAFRFTQLAQETARA